MVWRGGEGGGAAQYRWLALRKSAKCFTLSLASFGKVWVERGGGRQQSATKRNKSSRHLATPVDAWEHLWTTKAKKAARLLLYLFLARQEPLLAGQPLAKYSQAASPGVLDLLTPRAIFWQHLETVATPILRELCSTRNERNKLFLPTATKKRKPKNNLRNYSHCGMSSGR